MKNYKLIHQLLKLVEDFESENPTTNLFAPEKDFQDIHEGLTIIKEFYER